jgi:hypothetical protein
MWIISKWQSITPKVIVRGFKKCCISKAVDGTDDDVLCGIAVKRMAMLGVSVRKMEAPIVKMETVTLIGEGR